METALVTPASLDWRTAIAATALLWTPVSGCTDTCDALEEAVCREFAEGPECALMHQHDRRAHLSQETCERILAARVAR